MMEALHDRTTRQGRQELCRDLSIQAARALVVECRAGAGATRWGGDCRMTMWTGERADEQVGGQRADGALAVIHDPSHCRRRAGGRPWSQAHPWLAPVEHPLVLLRTAREEPNRQGTCVPGRTGRGNHLQLAPALALADQAPPHSPVIPAHGPLFIEPASSRCAS